MIVLNNFKKQINVLRYIIEIQDYKCYKIWASNKKIVINILLYIMVKNFYYLLKNQQKINNN